MSNVRRDAFDRAVAAWNAGDLDAYLDLYDERIRLYGYAPEPMGKAEVRDFYQGIWDALSDLTLEIHEVVQDDHQIGCRFTMHARTTASSPASRRPGGGSPSRGSRS